MKYVCLIWFPEEEVHGAMSAAESASFVNETLDNDESLRRSGNFVMAQALELPQTAVAVRVRDGRLSATDGPFIETKDHLTGFLMIEARDLNEAIRIAGTIPMARHGTIEVRPVRQIERVEGEGPG